MTHAELWMTYHQISRAHHPATVQLIDLDLQNHKLGDLEDVLEYVFCQGFVDAKHRPVSFWEAQDGHKIKGSLTVEDILNQGIGRCEQTALRLVIADAPPAMWFTYVYTHAQPPSAVTQRIKFDSPQTHFEKFAHLTNYIFRQGFLPPQYRSVVHWEQTCGTLVEESMRISEVLCRGEGLTETNPLRLVIDQHHEHPPCTPHHHGVPPTCDTHHHDKHSLCNPHHHIAHPAVYPSSQTPCGKFCL